MVEKLQRRSAIHYAAVSGQTGVLKALLSDSQLMHTEDGMLALKNVRIHDMSGQCRSATPFCSPRQGKSKLSPISLPTSPLCLHETPC